MPHFLLFSVFIFCVSNHKILSALIIAQCIQDEITFSVFFLEPYDKFLTIIYTFFRISTFSVVVFNAVLGIELLRGSFNDNQSEKNNRKKDRKNYPVLNGDRDTATLLVTLPDGSKGWTDGLGNGCIR